MFHHAFNGTSIKSTIFLTWTQKLYDRSSSFIEYDNKIGTNDKVVHGIEIIDLGVTHRILDEIGLEYFNMSFNIFQSDGTVEHLQIFLKQF